MARYSDLKRGPELAAAYAKYQAYLALDRPAKKAAYKGLNVNRLVATRIAAVIFPFGTTDLGIPMLVPTDNPAPDVSTTTAESKEADAALITRMKTILGTRNGQTTVANTVRVLDVPKFKPAKLFLKRVTGTASTEQVSRFTGIPYKRKQTNTLSSPFGKNGTETFEEVAKVIKAHAEIATHVSAGGSYRIVPQLSLIA
ncbi:hypothetical protein [Microcoleus sp. FACHB-68]|uniref:hypothetical protein n=1 Tax=Microcoleus sp. FACHB-68 TaxID=2692826 RepID=UPI0016837D3A|nr:hypothetical protein [Microcoleus sp. FACHB-68]MBD1939094.1 hypothetical protein [Microcoleus sp. FACHB-68]